MAMLLGALLSALMIEPYELASLRVGGNVGNVIEE
jgi:hypothetical protein